MTQDELVEPKQQHTPQRAHGAAYAGIASLPIPRLFL